MTKWCTGNFPNDTKSALGTAPMSFIFRKAKVLPICWNTYKDTNSLASAFKRQKSCKIILCLPKAEPIRIMYEGTNNWHTHRYACYIHKIPNAFQFGHQKGDLENLNYIKINFQYIDNLQSDFYRMKHRKPAQKATPTHFCK